MPKPRLHRGQNLVHSILLDVLSDASQKPSRWIMLVTLLTYVLASHGSSSYPPSHSCPEPSSASAPSHEEAPPLPAGAECSSHCSGSSDIPHVSRCGP
jgi:hypothetical protein